MRAILSRTWACILAGAPIILAGNRPMTFLDVLRFRTVAQGTLSPDASGFVYTVNSLDWQHNRRSTDLYFTGFDGSPTRQITFTPDRSEVSPAFSPDGKWLAFLSDRDQPPHPGSPVWQLYLLNLGGGEAREISHVPGGVGGFSFSSDGKWIAFTAGPPADRQIYLYDRSKNEAAALTRHPTGVDAMRWAPDGSTLYFTAPDATHPLDQKRIALGFDVRIVDPPASPVHLWQVSAVDGKQARLTGGDDFSVREFSVSSDGRWISFTGAPPDRFAERPERRDSEAYLLDTASLKVERLTQNDVAESLPAVSPDGRWVAFLAPAGYMYFRNRKVYLRPTRGGEWKTLLESWSGEPKDIAWAADSKTLYFNAGVGTAEDVFDVDVPGGKLARLSDGSGVTSGHYLPECNRFVLSYQTPEKPSEYYVALPSGLGAREHWARMSNANPQVAEFALGAYQTIHWKSSDGTTVEGILVKPSGYEPGKRYPLIVQLHGGPDSAVVRGFSANASTYVHVYSAGGYAVLQPNYRGSSNYGEQFRSQIAGDYFRLGFDDIMAGVDEVIRLGIADPNRLGLMGWSAGGHWANWTLTHTDRFKAIVSGAGAVDWISLYGETETRAHSDFYFGGTPYAHWDAYAAASPLKYIRNAKTPTLIEVGQDDPRIPLAQSEELHTALKLLGVPTEFLVYPHSGHGLTDPRYQLVKMEAEYNWFEKWIGGRKTWLDWKAILSTLPEGEKQ